MAYPRILLTRPIRRGLMIGLVAVFVFLAPAFLLYSAGYRYDPDARRLKVTGVISIEAEPADATITINNVRISKRLPLELTNRAPGRYQLRLEKPDYKPWEKEITVESKQTTYIKDIRLLRDQLPVPVEWTLPATSSLQFSTSPDGRYALVSPIESGIETITLFDTERAKPAVISRRAATEPSLLDWSPDSEALLLATRQKPGWRLTLISLSDPNRTASYRQGEESEPRWQWSAANDTKIFTRDGQLIVGLSLDGSETVATLAADRVWFVVEGQKLWTVDDEGHRVGPEALPAARETFPATIRLTAIMDINEERIIGRTDQVVAVIQRTDKVNHSQILSTPNLRYNRATSEWLAWSEFELWTIYKNGDTRLLNRSGDRLRAVYPLDETGVLLVVGDHGLTAFNPGYAVFHDLFSGKVERVGVNQNQRLIYFLGELAGRLGVFQLDY